MFSDDFALIRVTFYRLDEDGKVLTPEEILYRVCMFRVLSG